MVLFGLLKLHMKSRACTMPGTGLKVSVVVGGGGGGGWCKVIRASNPTSGCFKKNSLIGFDIEFDISWLQRGLEIPS